MDLFLYPFAVVFIQNSSEKTVSGCCQAVVQMVKMICTSLLLVETIDIAKAVKRLTSVIADVQVLRSVSFDLLCPRP